MKSGRRAKATRGIRIADLPECYQQQARERYAEALGNADNRTSNPVTDPKSVAKLKQVAVAKNPAFSSLVYVFVNSFRHRLPDSDGISGKAAIDGLVRNGILEDDSPRFVKNTFYSCEKVPMAEKEKTVIVIQTVDSYERDNNGTAN